MKRGYKTKMFQKSKEQPRLSFAVTGHIWTWEPWPWLAEAVCSLGLLRPARPAGVRPYGATQQIENLGTQQKVN